MLGIIGAMEQEVAKLKELMEDVQIVDKAGFEFYQGKLSGCEAVVVQAGIGKVNAARCTQALIDLFPVTEVVNTGVAGSLQAKIDIGDIVLSTDAVEHDMDVSPLGYAIGQTPGVDVLAYPADVKLRAIAKESCEKVNTDIKVFEGRVVSGDQFVSAKEKKEWIIENFGGYCTEMEGASIAHVAYLNRVPYLVIRAISDKADDSADMDYPTFEAQAIVHTVNLVMEMAARLA